MLLGERLSPACAPAVKNPPFDIIFPTLVSLGFPVLFSSAYSCCRLDDVPSENLVGKEEKEDFFFRIFANFDSLAPSFRRQTRSRAAGMPAKTHTPVAALPVDDAAQLKQAHALEKVAKNERKLARAANRAAKQAPAVAETPADVDMVDSEERTAAETKAARKASKKEKKKMQALEQVEEDVEMVPAPPSVVKATKRKAVEVEEVVTAKKSKLVAASEPTPLAPVASTSAAKSPPIDALPLPTVNKIYTAPARPVYAHADTDLNIPGISAPRPLASTSPVKKTVPRSAIDPSLLDADDDAVLAAMQKAGLARKSPPQVSPAKKSAAASSKGKGKEVQALEETPEELKARNKAEKKEAKRLAKELAANPSPPADSPEDILANAVASFQSTVPIVPREVVVKRKPAKVVVGKVAKPKVKAAKETTSKLSDAELLSLDVKEMLATQWLSSTRLKQLSAEKGESLPFPRASTGD